MAQKATAHTVPQNKEDINPIMKNILFYCSAALLLSSCSEHSGHTVSEFTGDYRYHAGIAEFFDCKKSVKYYVANAGIHTDLQERYLKLGIKNKDDVYMKVTGYLKEEQKIEGIDPSLVFVPVKFISLDKDRGCKRGIMQGG